MSTSATKGLLAVSSLAALLALGACGERVDTGERAATSPPLPQTTPATTDTASASGTTTPSATAEPDQPVGTTVMGATSATGPIDDIQIVTKVKTALAADGDLSALQINVDSKDGVVTLRGNAPDATAKDRATEIAKNVKDVKSVDNQLTTS